MLLFENQDVKPYMPIARRYRPTRFSDMVGQDSIVQVLTNAIKADRVHHAVLFTGTRGVGKTTMARILAKALNCQNRKADDPEPCNSCHSCISISESRNQGIIEIDAASNTGVADVRVIIDNSLYRPVDSKYKVYIIDEVHMLSGSAFNALLKIIEEPPHHLKFIFATTEYNKIPKTILSRCFKLFLAFVPVSVLKMHCRKIVELEGAKSDDLALEIIAKAAQGSARDALSLLDQAMILGKMNIESKIVSEMLYFNKLDLIFDVFLSVVNGNVNSALDYLTHCYSSGIPPSSILSLLIDLFHSISQFILKRNDFNFEELIKERAEIIQSVDFTFILRGWQVLIRGFQDMKYAPSQLHALEMLIIKLCYLNETTIPQKLLESCNTKQQSVGHHSKADSKADNPPTVVHQDVQNPNDNNEQQCAINSVKDILEALYKSREFQLYNIFYHKISVIEISFPRIVISCNPEVITAKTIKMIEDSLTKSTGLDCKIEISTISAGTGTVGEILKQEEAQKKGIIEQSPLVQKILNSFTGSKITDIKIEES